MSTIASVHQLLATGWTPQRIRTAVAAGRIVRLRQGWYSVADPDLRADDRAWAFCERLDAVLAAHPRAVASHATASWLLGFGELPRRIEVTVPHSAILRPEAGVRVHRSTRPLPAVLVGNRPVVDASHTVVDLARRLPQVEGTVIGDAALHAKACTPADIAAAAVTARGLRGIARALRALADVRPGAQSPQETRIRLGLIGLGLPEPVLQHAVTAGRVTYHLDISWPDDLEGVEYDGGEAHGNVAAVVRDRRRWIDLRGAGWTIWPLTAADARDLRPVAEAIRRSLAR
jgi:hypothetical protein